MKFGRGRKNTRFSDVDAHPRGDGEGVDEGKGVSNGINMSRTEGKVVCSGKWSSTRNLLQLMDESIIGKDKKERRQRTPLFNAPKDREVKVRAQERTNHDVRKQAADGH